MPCDGIRRLFEIAAGLEISYITRKMHSNSSFTTFDQKIAEVDTGLRLIIGHDCRILFRFDQNLCIAYARWFGVDAI